MKVVTLETSLFRAICHKLALAVKEQYNPDVVIAILSGGGYVAREMLHTLNTGKDIAYGEVSACRPGNDLKQNGIKKLLEQSRDPDYREPCGPHRGSGPGT